MSDSSPSAPLIDGHGRLIQYLRLSVTDRCNLRCRYCYVDNAFIPHNDILRYEEMLRLVRIFYRHGVRKLRLTGGEPFVRKGFPDFLRSLHSEFPDMALRMTTNGVLAAPHAALLKELGVGVNLSLDSLKRERFHHITGMDTFDDVLASFHALLEHGVPLKVNAVAIKGFNDDELPDFLQLAVAYPIDVRFIEFMPMGEATVWNKSNIWQATDILKAARTLMPLSLAPRNAATDGPATMYSLGSPRAQGRLGLITPLSNHYCATCNRLRLTADGRLRTCLYDDREYHLTPILRSDTCCNDDAPVEKAILAAITDKPIGAELLAARRGTAVAQKSMHTIGG